MGNEVAVGLVVLHLEGDVQLAAFVVVALVVPGVGAAVALGGAGAHCFGRRGRKIGGGQLRGCIAKVHPTPSNWIMKRDPHPHIFHPLSSFFSSTLPTKKSKSKIIAKKEKLKICMVPFNFYFFKKEIIVWSVIYILA